ncbi:uncharacterized protein LOC108732740 [Agrilus planipennis]|uniref:Uncharacterized protein LOC108732740 n=1 Tax=Agrilus planipennis TaxID=224129 RepID=A0A1W4WGQ7_AGRPL|nr:uncharacterized protein LOC108732740 [Agrilus planipennis]
MGCCSPTERESCCDDSCESSESSNKCQTHYRRSSCFGTCSGLNFICVAFLSFVLFLTATGLVAYYMTEYHGKNLKWREYKTTEDREQSMNTHAVLTTFGFITLAGIGITMYRVSTCCERSSLRVLHIFILLAAAVAIGYGVYIPYEINELQERPHFYSTHSWAGLIACGLFALVLACGFLKFILLLMCGPVSCCLRASCIPIHAGLGLAAYWTAIVAIVSAIQRDLVEANIKRKKYKGADLGLWWGDTLNDFLEITKREDQAGFQQVYYKKLRTMQPRHRRPIFVVPQRPRKMFPQRRFTLTPKFNPERIDETTVDLIPQQTDLSEEIETTTLPSPPHLPGKDPVYPGGGMFEPYQEENFEVARVHLAGGLSFLLVCCGLLVTYSVLSRFWCRR